MSGHLVGTVFRGPALDFGGNYRIADIVQELGVPGRYRVRLFHRHSGRFIAQTWSDAQGNFAFDRLALDTYFVVGFDHGADPVQAAVADFLVPEPMPQ